MTAGSEIPDKLVVLLRSLIAKTDSQKIVWQETDDEQRFVYSTARSSVFVDGRTDRDGDFVGGISIVNVNGSEVEKLRTDFAGQNDDGSYVKGPNNRQLQQLFTLARRSALDIDLILDELIGDLEDE